MTSLANAEKQGSFYANRTVPDTRKMVKNINIEGFRSLFQESCFKNPAMVFSAYRELYASNQSSQLDAEDHTGMLGLLAMSITPVMSAKFTPNVIDNLVKGGFQLDMRDHHLVLAIHYRAKLYDHMIDYFDLMTNTHLVKPSVKSFNFLMAAYTKQNKLHNVIATWKSMVTSWPGAKYVNQEAWAWIITAQGQAGKAIEAEKSYHELIVKVGSQNIQQDVIDAMIATHINSIEQSKGIALFESLNFNPNNPELLLNSNDGLQFSKILQSFDSFIRALFKANEADLAIDYFNQLLEICSIANEKVPGHLPLPSTFRSMIDHYFDHLQDTDMVIGLYEEQHPWLFPNADSNEKVFWSYWTQDEKTKAIQIYEGMRRIYQIPSDDILESVQSHIQ